MQAVIELPDDLIRRLDALESYTNKSRDAVVQELLDLYVRVNEARRRFAETEEPESAAVDAVRAAGLDTMRTIEW